MAELESSPRSLYVPGLLNLGTMDFILEVCPMHCNRFRGTCDHLPSRYQEHLLPAVTTKDVSRQNQMSIGGQVTLRKYFRKINFF
jgi:hypothetical protein